MEEDNNGVTIPKESCDAPRPPVIETRRLTPAEVESSLQTIFGNSINVYQFNGLSRGLSLSAFSTEPAANATSREAILSIYELSESVALQIRNDFQTYFSCTDTTSCVDELSAGFGRLLFRHRWSNDEKASYLKLSQTLENKGMVIEDIVVLLVEKTIMSPQFLFRLPSQESPNNEDIKTLSDVEFASRLSLVLAGKVPDTQLLDAAERGDFSDPLLVEEQIAHLLNEGGGFNRFLLEWLDLKTSEEFEADGEAFEFGLLQRQTVIKNGEAFFQDQLENGNYKTLLTAINPAFGPYGENVGILNHPYFLASHAHAFEGSEILRGSRILSRVLCYRFGSLPLNALDVEKGLVSSKPDANKKELSEARNGLPECAFCHELIDPVGLALESYGAIGQSQNRGYDVEGAIKVGGTMFNFKNAEELSQSIAESAEYEDCFSRQLFRFTMSRMEKKEDACSLAYIREEIATHDLKEALTHLFSSPLFRNQSARGEKQ